MIGHFEDNYIIDLRASEFVRLAELTAPLGLNATNKKP